MFDTVIRALENTSLKSLDPGDETLAFWINAYNIAVVHLIAEAYPISSIKDIGTSVQPVWNMNAISIDHKSYTLEEIEREVASFHNPKVRFALFNGSISGPDLRTEAYTKSKLQLQLEDQTKSFLQNETKGCKMDFGTNTLLYSKLFEWFQSDFGSETKIKTFIYPYVPVNLSATTKFIFYDWGLND